MPSVFQEIQNTKRNDYRRRLKQEDEQRADNANGEAQDRDTESPPREREEKSTTPRIVTLGNGSRDEDTDASVDGEDEPSAAKKARTSLAHRGRYNGYVGSNLKHEEGRDTESEGDAENEVAEDDEGGDEEEEEEIDEEEDGEMEYQSAEEGLELNEDDDLDELRDESDGGGMNPDPDDEGDPGGSEDDY